MLTAIILLSPPFVNCFPRRNTQDSGRENREQKPEGQMSEAGIIRSDPMRQSRLIKNLRHRQSDEKRGSFSNFAVFPAIGAYACFICEREQSIVHDCDA